MARPAQSSRRRQSRAHVPRDTPVSWQTLALFVLFPPAAVIALALSPITLLVAFWLYQRGK